MAQRCWITVHGPMAYWFAISGIVLADADLAWLYAAAETRHCSSFASRSRLTVVPPPAPIPPLAGAAPCGHHPPPTDVMPAAGRSTKT